MPWWLFAPSPLAAAFLTLVGATAPTLRASLGIGYGGLAALFVAQALGAFAGAAAVGMSRPNLLSPTRMAIGLALSLAAVALFPSFRLALPALVLGGFACYAINARAQSELSRRAGRERAHALARFHLGGSLGLVLFPLAVAMLLAVGGSWRGAFLGVAAVFAVFGGVFRAWDYGAAPHAAVRQAPLGSRVRWALVMGVVALGVQAVVPLWIPSIVHDRYDASPSFAGATVAMFGVALAAARLLGLRTLGRLGEARQLQLGCSFAVAGFAVLALGASSVAVVIGALMIGGGVAQMLPLGIARAARASGEDRLVTSLAMALGSGAQIALPVSVVGLSQVMNLQGALAATVGISVGVIAVALHRS